MKQQTYSTNKESDEEQIGSEHLSLVHRDDFPTDRHEWTIIIVKQSILECSYKVEVVVTG